MHLDLFMFDGEAADFFCYLKEFLIERCLIIRQKNVLRQQHKQQQRDYNNLVGNSATEALEQSKQSKYRKQHIEDLRFETRSNARSLFFTLL